MSINIVCIGGNLTRDAELKTTPAGQSVCDFSVAVNSRAKNAQTGEWEDVPNYVDCTLWGTRAAALDGKLLRGTHVNVQGKLRMESWNDRTTGQKRNRLKVLVDELDIGKRGERGASRDEAAAHDLDKLDDIPF